MKNKLALCFILFLVMTMSCITAYATENTEEKPMVEATDSVNISDKEVQKLGVSANEQVIKVYNLYLVEAFARCETIEDMVSKYSDFPSNYIVVSKASINRIIEMNWNNEIKGVYSDLEFLQNRYKLGVKEIMDKSAVKLIAADIKIENCYFINGEGRQGDGIAIYYDTNLGTFIYYNQGGNEYLFPLEKFVEMMRTVDDSRGPDTPPGGGSISAPFDLSQYDIHSKTFNIDLESVINSDIAPNETIGSQSSDKDNTTYYWIVCSALFLFLAATIGYFVYRNKKRKDTL